MKRLGLIPQLLSATLFLGGGLRAADENKPATSAPGMMKPARADELLQRFDTNHDGKLDEDEVAAAHEILLKEQMDRQAAVAKLPGSDELRRKMLEKFDTNHDGRLDDDERAAMRKYAEEHGLGPNGEVREELLKRFDKNGDGKLDDTERAEMEKFLQNRRAQSTNLREFLLRQFDRNNNGKIDDDELPAFEKAMRARMESNPQQLARFDKDGDGKIDDAEWAAAREQILRIVNSPPPASGSDKEEQAKLRQISDEVARRRAERLQREATPNDAPKPPS